MEEETQDKTCKSSGSIGWKPNRRELIRSAAIAGIGITAALTMETVQQYAEAETVICSQLYQICRDNCSGLSPAERFLCLADCLEEFIACEAEAAARGLADAIGRAKDWVVGHIEEIVIGSIIVIGVIALVVVAWPVIVAAGEGAILASGGAAAGTIGGVAFGFVFK